MAGYSLIGMVEVTVRDADGTIASRNYYNTATNFTKNAIAKWLSGVSTATVAPPNRISAGNGSPPSGQTASPTDTALWSTIAGTNKACDTIQISNSYYAQYNLAYQTSDPVGAYTELGLLDAGGNLWAHVVINQYKSATQTLTVQWVVSISPDPNNVSSKITNYFRITVVKWLTGTSNVAVGTLPPTQTRLGTGSGTLLASDTALWTPTASTTKTCDYINIVSSYNVQYATTYLSADPMGTFTEVGWFDTAGNLWTHSNFAGATKATSNDQLAVVGQIGVVGN